MIVTLYKNRFDRFGTPVSAEWSELVEILTSHDIRGSTDDKDDEKALDTHKDGACIILGEIPEGVPRAGKNMRSVSAIGIDLDNVDTDYLGELFEPIKGFAWAVYTTHKNKCLSKETGARLRLILPLSRPVPPKTHGELWEAAHCILACLPDAQTKDVNRLHYLPSSPDPALCWSAENEGSLISPEQLIELSPVDPKKLHKIRTKLKRVRKGDPRRESIDKLLHGEPIGQPGERHATVLEITQTLAHLDPKLPEDILHILFSPSLKAAPIERKGDGIWREITDAYNGAVEKLSDFDKLGDLEYLEEILNYQVAAARQPATYTQEQLEELAHVAGSSVEALKSRWIVSNSGTYWFLNEKGEYGHAHHKDDAYPAIYKALARSPVPLYRFTRDGNIIKRTFVDIRVEAGTVAKRVVSSMTAEYSSYDEDTQTLTEAVTPLRADLEPKHDPVIDIWLSLLAGDHYERLKQWLAYAPDLNELLCALYFSGASNTGKNLFAQGVASLWTHGPPCDFDPIVKDFTEQLLNCPLVFGDEALPKADDLTAILRNVLSVRSRKLKIKHRNSTDLEGAIRMVLAANHEHLLATNEGVSGDDLEAISERILHLTPSIEAAQLLRELGNETLREWAHKGIAEHALWLAENEKQPYVGRFAVSGKTDVLHRISTTSSYWVSVCCEWIVRWIQQPSILEGRAPGKAFWEKGEIYVNAQAIIDGWNMYLTTKKEPVTRRIGGALRAIGKQVRMHNARYWQIDKEYLKIWVDTNQIGEYDEIERRIFK